MKIRFQSTLFISVLFVCIILGKFLFAFLATYFIHHPLKIAILVGAGLAHMGEFSFVIIKMGLQHNLISEHFFNLYLTSALLTMFVTPVMIRKSPTLINSLNRVAFLEKWLRGKEDRNTAVYHCL